MHGNGSVVHGNGISRIDSSSCEPALKPFSLASRQSPCPANASAFTVLSQPQTVVVAPLSKKLVMHVPVAHRPHPSVPSASAMHVADAAASGWQWVATVVQS